MVIDYAKSTPKDWIQDGFSFGIGPVRPGELRYGTDPARPILQDRTSAVRPGRTRPGMA